MCGVRRLVLPFRLRSPQPWSSARMMTTFGLAAGSAAFAPVQAAASSTTMTLATNRMRWVMFFPLLLLHHRQVQAHGHVVLLLRPRCAASLGDGLLHQRL